MSYVQGMPLEKRTYVPLVRRTPSKPVVAIRFRSMWRHNSGDNEKHNFSYNFVNFFYTEGVCSYTS